MPEMPSGMSGGQQGQIPGMAGGINGGQQEQMPEMPGGTNGGQQGQMPGMPGGTNGGQQGQMPEMPSGMSGGQQGQMPEMSGETNSGQQEQMPGMPGGINGGQQGQMPEMSDTYTASDITAAVPGYGVWYSVDAAESVSAAEAGAEYVTLTKEQEKAAAKIEKLLYAYGQVTFEKIEKLFDSIGFVYKGNDELIVNRCLVRKGWSKEAADILNDMLKRGTIKLTDGKGGSYSEVMCLPASSSAAFGFKELDLKIELC